MIALSAMLLNFACSFGPETGETGLNNSASANYQINGYEASYQQVYLRGSFNGWDITPMTLTADNYWQAEITFTESADQSFKFDIYGDWSLNFGDNNNDHMGDQNGKNIPVTPGKTYIITFNDNNAYYSIYEKTWNAHIKINVPSGLVASDFQGLKTWKYEADQKTGWNYIYTDSEDQSSVYSPVSGLLKGSYTVKFDDVIAGARYTGSVSFTIDGNQDTLSNTLELTQAPLTNFGYVKLQVLTERYENGGLTASPVNAAGIYLGDWHGGYLLGTTDVNGTVTVALEQGVQDLSMFKMTSSHSIMSRYIEDVTVEANQTNNVEIRTAPTLVSVNAYAEAGFGNALYITGDTSYLGQWSQAYKMDYDNTRGCWTFSKYLPIGLPFKIVKAPWVDGDSIPTAGVIWESGSDRVVPNPSYIDVSITANPRF